MWRHTIYVCMLSVKQLMEYACLKAPKDRSALLT